MKHHRLAITGILLAQVLFFGIPTMAADPVTVDTVDTDSTEWKQCVSLLRLNPNIAKRGTYKIRVVECVNEKLRDKEIGDVDREHRLNLRARNVIEAFRSGRLGATARSVDTRRFSNNDNQVPQDTGTSPRFTRRIPTVQNVNRSTSNANYSRPSRRSIQDNAYSQSIEDKQTESEIFQQRWKDAIEASRAIDNNFRRNNCIRKRLRQSGL